MKRKRNHDGEYKLKAVLGAVADELLAQAKVHNAKALERLDGWGNRRARQAVLNSSAVCHALEASIRRAIKD